MWIRGKAFGFSLFPIEKIKVSRFPEAQARWIIPKDGEGSCGRDCRTARGM